jgi:hypothetical protein
MHPTVPPRTRAPWSSSIGTDGRHASEPVVFFVGMLSPGQKLSLTAVAGLVRTVARIASALPIDFIINLFSCRGGLHSSNSCDPRLSSPDGTGAVAPDTRCRRRAGALHGHLRPDPAGMQQARCAIRASGCMSRFCYLLGAYGLLRP